MMGSGSMMGMGMCMPMMLLGFLLVIAIIGVTVYMVTGRLMKNSRVTDHPLAVLKELYAKGEISEEDYEQRRKVLNKK